MRAIRTDRLVISLNQPQEILDEIMKLSEADQAEISPEWLRMVQSSNEANPWIHGFSVQLVPHQHSGDSEKANDSVAIGRIGFKGPPDESGMVEIAYGIEPEYQGKGYATEATIALSEYALGYAEVDVVRAHTLPKQSASTRVLEKCGFAHLGVVADPEDGAVWRFELRG